MPDGESEGVPFECSDYYGRTGLTIAPHESDEPSKARIADAFWNVLLENPDDLADFETRVFHPGAGVWLRYGCESGEPYCRESDDDDPGF